MRPTVRTTTALCCAAVLLLAGCTSEAPAPTSAPTSAASEPSLTPTPTPTPTATGPMDRSDAALGIQFENLPDVTGDARAALDLYTLFEVEYWRSTTEGVVADLIPAMASREVVAVVQAQVDGNAEVDISGVNRVRILDIVADAASATITTCQDPTEATVTYQDGTTKPGREAGARVVKVVTGLLKEPDLPWQVVTVDNTGEAC